MLNKRFETNSTFQPTDGMPQRACSGSPTGECGIACKGTPREARPDEFISKRLGAMPENGEPAVWLQHLGEVFAAHPQAEEVIAWLRWWLRYSLGTSCTDESIVFLDGPPRFPARARWRKVGSPRSAGMAWFAEATGSPATALPTQAMVSRISRGTRRARGRTPEGRPLGRGKHQFARVWRGLGGEQDAPGFDGIPIREQITDHGKPSAVGRCGFGFLAAAAATRMPIAPGHAGPHSQGANPGTKFSGESCIGR